MKILNFYFLSRILFLAILVSLFNFNLFSQDLTPSQWPHMKGYWKFQNASQLTKATVGNNLELVGSHGMVTGPSYGDTAIRIGIGSYYRCKHLIPPNGGGDSVNRYTLMFDFKVLNFDRWHTFFQTDSTNMNDGECFIRPNTGTNPGCIGTATTSYTPNPINANKWYRLVISVNLGNFYRYYLDGKLILEGDTQDIDNRFALTPLILFFADNSQEDDTIDVASLAIFDTCLSATDIAKIGSIDPCVAKPPKINLGADTTLCAYNSLTKNAGSGFTKYQWSTGATVANVTLDTTKLKIGLNTVWAKVTDINNCTAVDTLLVKYLAAPVVNLGTNKTICQGQTVNLVAGTDTSNKYLWKYLPSGVTLSTLISITVDSAGKYLAIVTSSFGCANRDTITITVNKNPIKPTITVPGKTSFCTGDSIKLIGPVAYAGYTWSNGAKLQQIYIKKSDIIRLKVKDNNGCESPYSDSVVTTAFILPPAPTIQITGDTSFCLGDSVLFKVPSVYPDYIWSNGKHGQQQIFKTASKYFVKVTDINGCTSPNSRKVTVTVYSLPPKPVISITGLTAFCHGDSTILIAPAGYMQYHWQDGNVNNSRAVKNTGSFKVYVVDLNHCSSVFSDTTDILVYANPAKPVISLTGDKEFCDGDSLLLTAPSGYTEYHWQDGLGKSKRTEKHNGAFYVYVVDSNYCISPVSDTVDVLVHANPAKPVITVSGDTVICEGETTLLSATAGYAVYHWSDNHNNQIDTVTVTGNYRVKVETIYGCFSEWSDSIGILVHPLPSKPQVIKFGKDSLKSSVTANKYRWFKNGMLLSDTNISMRALSTGYYKVQTKNLWCWSELSDSFLFQKLGLADGIAHESKLIIYPNPAQNEIFIKLINLEGSGNISINIIDIRGRKVQEAVTSFTEIESGTKVNITNLTPGIYMVSVVTPWMIYYGRIEKL